MTTMHAKFKCVTDGSNDEFRSIYPMLAFERLTHEQTILPRNAYHKLVLERVCAVNRHDSIVYLHLPITTRQFGQSAFCKSAVLVQSPQAVEFARAAALSDIAAVAATSPAFGFSFTGLVRSAGLVDIQLCAGRDRSSISIVVVRIITASRCDDPQLPHRQPAALNHVRGP